MFALDPIIEQHLSEDNIIEAVNRLKFQPEDLVNALDRLVRISTPTDIDHVEEALQQVGHEASMITLFKTYTHFLHRDNSDDRRLYVPRGSKIIPKHKPGADVIKGALYQTLLRKASERRDIGNIYIHPEVHGMVVSLEHHIANRPIQTIGRGSSLCLPDDMQNFRYFVQWSSKYDPEELQLSGVLISEDWTDSKYIWFGNLHGTNGIGYHDGYTLDSTSSYGASEFIDINMDAVVRAGYRYVLMSVYNFSYIKYKELPEAFVGWMIRKQINSSADYDPRMVIHKFDITTDYARAYPILFDVIDRKAYWLDLGSSALEGDVLDILQDTAFISKIQTLMKGHQPNLRTLIEIHARVRGGIVYYPEDADVIVSLTGDITPSQIDKIIEEFL